MTHSNEPPTSRQLSNDDASISIDITTTLRYHARDREPAPAHKLACIHISRRRAHLPPLYLTI
jgi:hypothetical protein